MCRGKIAKSIVKRTNLDAKEEQPIRVVLWRASTSGAVRWFDAALRYRAFEFWASDGGTKRNSLERVPERRHGPYGTYATPPCATIKAENKRERERERGETDCRLIYGCGDDAESEWAVSPVPLTRIRRQARRPNGRTDFVHIQIRRTERERKREVLHATSNSNDKQLFIALFVWVGKQNRDETKRRKKECTTQRRMKDRKRRNVNEVSALSLWAAPAAAQISNDAPISGPAKEEKMER